MTRNRFVFFTVAFLALLWAVMSNQEQNRISSEAVIRSCVAADLLDGLVAGRQGFVGSLRWSPLPTLLVLPMMPIPELARTGFAACVVAAFAVACLATFLNNWWTSYGLARWARMLLLLAYLTAPATLRSIVSGASAALFVFFIVTSTCFLIHWLETLKLRSLAYLAILASLAVVTRYQAIFFGLGALAILIVHLVLEREKEAYSEGTLIVFLAPFLYVCGLWVAANWLIMGEPFFFLRGLLPSRLEGVTLGGILSEGCEWSECILPLALAMLAWAMRHVPSLRLTSPLASNSAASAVALVILVVSALLRPNATATPPPDDEIAAVLNYIEKIHPYDKMIISGYCGYEVLKHVETPERYIHTLSLYLEKIYKETKGQRLYLIVPRPRGWYRWEDITLKFPGIYTRGSDFTLLERAWENWQLLRVVRTDV